jgi:hypothetical protein
VLVRRVRAKSDEPAQLLDPLGHIGGAGQGKPRIEGGKRLFRLVVAVEIAADQEQRDAAFDRVR